MSSPHHTPPSSPTATLIWSVVILSVVTIIGIVTSAVLLPGNTTLIVQILAVIVPTSAALMAVLKSTQNQTKIEGIRVDVNSRLSQLLESKSAQSRAEGVIEGSGAMATTRHADTIAAAVEAARVAMQAAQTAKAAAEEVVRAAKEAAEILVASSKN